MRAQHYNIVLLKPETSGDHSSLDEVIRRVKEEAAECGARAGGAAAPAEPAVTHRTALAPLPPEIDALPRPLTLAHYQDFHDETFVRLVYRELLKREPEPAAMADVLEKLRSGAASKLDIVAGVRYSEEGRRAGVEVPGLERASKISRLFQLPVIGYALQVLNAMVRLPVVMANQQRFEADVHRRFAAIHEAFRLELLGPLGAKADKVSIAELHRQTARMAFNKVDREAMLDVERRLKALEARLEAKEGTGSGA